MAEISSRPGPRGASFGSVAEAGAVGVAGGLPKQAQIRLSSDAEKWPRVAELVEDMERRRDSAEDLVHSRIISSELRLLEARRDVH